MQNVAKCDRTSNRWHFSTSTGRLHAKFPTLNYSCKHGTRIFPLPQKIRAPEHSSLQHPDIESRLQISYSVQPGWLRRHQSSRRSLSGSQNGAQSSHGKILRNQSVSMVPGTDEPEASTPAIRTVYSRRPI